MSGSKSSTFTQARKDKIAAGARRSAHSQHHVSTGKINFNCDLCVEETDIRLLFAEAHAQSEEANKIAEIRRQNQAGNVSRLVAVARTSRECRYKCGMIGQLGPISKHEKICATSYERLLVVLKAAEFVNVGDVSKCWIKRGTDGLKRTKLGGVRVHRVAYRALYGDYPAAGLVVRHNCDHSGCGNPHHMLAGTQADNIADMWSRGRGVLGGFIKPRPYTPKKYRKDTR